MQPVEDVNQHEVVAENEEATRWLPAMLFLFVGSGCAALIYEVVWFQLLQLSIGSSAVSLGVLLGIFMGGMCLGSLVMPRLLSARQHPLRIYALLETGIALFGILVLWLVPVLGNIYVSSAGSGAISLVLRAAVAGLCLIPPTLLMGRHCQRLDVGSKRLRVVSHGSVIFTRVIS